MKAYYAHCVALYGTVQEERDLEALEALGLDVLNPNHPTHAEGCQAVKDSGGNVMDYFKPLVESAEVFVFRALPDGSIPSGVALEHEWALAAGKIIIELPSNVVRRKLDYPQTCDYLRDVGYR